MKALCVLIAAFAVAVSATPDCSEAIAYISCMKEANITVDPNGGLHPENEEELSNKCRSTVPLIKCLVEYSTRCPSSFPKYQPEYFAEQYKVEKELCTRGSDLWSRFLKESACVNRHFTTIQECGGLQNVDVNKPDCPRYFQTLRCIVLKIGQLCGAGAAQVSGEVGGPLFNYLNKMCEN